MMKNRVNEVWFCGEYPIWRLQRFANAYLPALLLFENPHNHHYWSMQRCSVAIIMKELINVERGRAKLTSDAHGAKRVKPHFTPLIRFSSCICSLVKQCV